jgi:hypothetical protein
VFESYSSYGYLRCCISLRRVEIASEVEGQAIPVQVRTGN